MLALLLAGAFLVIGVQAGSEVSDERVHRVGYWLRKRWLALLLVIGVLVVGISLFDLPYASGGAAGRTVVKVTGGQFFWSLVPDRVPAGTRVRFDVTSIDVNHGFGLYDPHGHLIGSVQAMPGYHNKLDLTLSEAGRLPDPLPRAVRAQPLDHGGHLHGDARADGSRDHRRSVARLHPRAAAFTVEARGDRAADRPALRRHRHRAGRC